MCDPWSMTTINRVRFSINKVVDTLIHFILFYYKSSFFIAQAKNMCVDRSYAELTFSDEFSWLKISHIIFATNFAKGPFRIRMVHTRTGIYI